MKPAARTTSDLLRTHRRLWAVTCRNPFVLGVRDGSLPRELFDQWLVQDRHFIDGTFPVACRAAASAPVEDRPVLLEAIEGLLTFLAWFDRTLAARGLDPRRPMHPIVRAYRDYLLALGFESYPIVIVALWTQYRAYGDAWRWASGGARRYRDVIRRWSSPAYDAFVRRLQRAADRALATSSPRERAKAAEAFVHTLHYELATWVMTLGDLSPRTSPPAITAATRAAARSRPASRPATRATRSRP